MQKVEGSSPFIRFKESPAQAGLLLPRSTVVPSSGLVIVSPM